MFARDRRDTKPFSDTLRENRPIAKLHFFVLILSPIVICDRSDAFVDLFPVRVDSPASSRHTHRWGPRPTTRLNLRKEVDRRTVLLIASTSSVFTPPRTAEAAGGDWTDGSEPQGISAVTQSGIGKSIRRSTVRSAQLADAIDEKWERFSDSLRDKNKCDPATNRRLFDNGFRRDGTRVGNPVLGALCDPVPLRPFDEVVATTVLTRAREAALETGLGKNGGALQAKVDDVKSLVGPTFARAASSKEGSGDGQRDDGDQRIKRQGYNMDMYTSMRAYGELIAQSAGGSDRTVLRKVGRIFDEGWGSKVLEALAPRADRRDFSSPFPPPDDDAPYDQGVLLDALGAVSAALRNLQDAGLVGQFELSIPEDDYGTVVTIAVDDDVSIGAQVLLREQGLPLGGSVVVALVRSALDRTKIPYKIDSFFIDPSTTKQDVYNPSQLLVNLSELGG